MAKLELIGTPEPFLHVQLNQGEKIFCESDSMVMMESNLVMAGKARGGILQSVLRRFATGESLFQQEIEAKFGQGECLLSPNLDGDMQILDVGRAQYMLSDGAFVAATQTVDIRAKVQSNIGGALFGGTGGFVIMETAGQGQVAISGFGTLMEVQVEPGTETTIDNGHVVAWDSSLQYNIGMPSAQDRGFVGNLINSVTSGEGLVIKFNGSGKVIICSRNRQSYLTWLGSMLPSAPRN